MASLGGIAAVPASAATTNAFRRVNLITDSATLVRFGTGGTAGTRTLLFSAGINDEHDGLVGSITAVP